jgi:putative ABC transport system ATP-binding protein
MPLVYSHHYRKLSAQEMHQRSLDALKQVGLEDRKNHRPNELSGGQRQRVAIARALVNQPRLILADEPTGNLDSKSGQAIIELFHNLHKDGATIILVTHDPKLALAAERVVTLADGKIASDIIQ